MVSRNQTEVETIQLDEENSVGTPPEHIELNNFNISTSMPKDNTRPQTSVVEDRSEVVKAPKKGHSPLPRRTIVKNHCRTLSNDSFTKVDESSRSPSRQHRNTRSRDRKTRLSQLENHSRERYISKGSHSVLVYAETSLKNDYQSEDNPCYIID